MANTMTDMQAQMWQECQ
jgi:hypothetical protein